MYGDNNNHQVLMASTTALGKQNLSSCLTHTRDTGERLLAEVQVCVCTSGRVQYVYVSLQRTGKLGSLEVKGLVKTAFSP